MSFSEVWRDYERINRSMDSIEFKLRAIEIRMLRLKVAELNPANELEKVLKSITHVPALQRPLIPEFKVPPFPVLRLKFAELAELNPLSELEKVLKITHPLTEKEKQCS